MYIIFSKDEGPRYLRISLTADKNGVASEVRNVIFKKEQVTQTPGRQGRINNVDLDRD